MARITKTAVCVSLVPAVLSHTGAPIEVGDKVEYLRLTFRNGESHLVIGRGKQVPAAFFQL